MNETVNTVTIQGENGPVLINESDFDKSVHKLVKGEKLTQVPVINANADHTPTEHLVGSNVQPASFILKDDSIVTLGEVVAKAHETSNLSIQAWNELPEDQREKFIADQVSTLDLNENQIQEPKLHEGPFTVGKNGKRGAGSKFVVFDKNGDKVGDAEYDNEADAWAATLPTA